MNDDRTPDFYVDSLLSYLEFLDQTVKTLSAHQHFSSHFHGTINSIIIIPKSRGSYLGFFCMHTHAGTHSRLAGHHFSIILRTSRKNSDSCIGSTPRGKGGVDPLQELRGRSSEQFSPVEDREGSFQCKGRSSEWIPNEVV